MNVWYRVGSQSGLESGTYRVRLRIPAFFRPLRGYEERYGSAGGFVQLSAAGAGQVGLEAAVFAEAKHPLEPYGSNPCVKYGTIAGQNACRIRPSADQSPEMERQAALLVRYPRAVRIAGSTYSFFVLRADEERLEVIGNTLAFMV